MIVWLLYGIIVVYRFVLDYWDMKYRMSPPHLVSLIFLVISFIEGYLLYGLSPKLFFNFFTVSIIFIIVELVLGNGVNPVIGGGDIVCAPIFSITVQNGFLIYFALIAILNMIADIKPVRAFLGKWYVGNDYEGRLPAVPLMPIMHLAGLITFGFIQLLKVIL